MLNRVKSTASAWLFAVLMFMGMIISSVSVKGEVGCNCVPGEYCSLDRTTCLPCSKCSLDEDMCIHQCTTSPCPCLDHEACTLSTCSSCDACVLNPSMDICERCFVQAAPYFCPVTSLSQTMNNHVIVVGVQGLYFKEELDFYICLLYRSNT